MPPIALATAPAPLRLKAATSKIANSFIRNMYNYYREVLIYSKDVAGTLPAENAIGALMKPRTSSNFIFII